MYDLIYGLILSTKYVCVSVLMFAFPSETVMPIVGYAAWRGHIWFPAAVFVGVLGTTLWGLMIYGIARWVGPKGLDALITQYGKFLGISKASVNRAGAWFDRYAGTTVFVGRFVPGLRTAVCVPAGLRRMPLGRFLMYSLLGSIADVLLLAALGYAAHTYFHELRLIVDSVSHVIVLSLVGLTVAWWLWYRSRTKRNLARREGLEPSNPGFKGR
jgi:membrane protein DedA with SNARE-associated domain